jgi:hypothetical protein
MNTHQVRKKRRAGRGQALKKPSQSFHSEPLALPEEEIRRLVVLSTTRYKIEPFARQLIKLMDELKAGQTHNIAKLTRPGRDQSRAILLAAIAKTVNEGRTMAAYHTAYQAALYAYENTLDHLMAFHDYLDYLRQKS